MKDSLIQMPESYCLLIKRPKLVNSYERWKNGNGMYNSSQSEAILENFIELSFYYQHLTFLALLHLDKHIRKKMSIKYYESSLLMKHDLNRYGYINLVVLLHC